MKFFLLFLSAVTGASAGFIPSIRVDHESRGSRMCYNSAIVLGPEDGFSQPVYVVFENDSFAGSIIVQQDIYFQRSTDGGLTWLSEDRLVRRGAPFACYPDIAVDRSGCIYIVYTERTDNTAHICCIRSTD
ncbi:MAG: sialidase family protein, partial [candidate division WOR-3 bacterium]